MIDSVPTGNAAVTHIAVSEEESVAAAQPVMVIPFAVKLNMPVGIGGPAGATVAVKVTDSPTVDGFALEVSVVAEAARLTTCARASLLLE